MTKLIPFLDSEQSNALSDGRGDQGRFCCEQLEEGNILFLARTPFALPDSDRQFLLSQQQSGAVYHKNIAYRPQQDRLTGFVKRSVQDQERLRSIMRTYSERVTQFLLELLPPYAGAARIDFASFRPLEEQGRPLRVRARNDLLHVDSFPTRPTNGDRIMRVFTNINPSVPRVWLTSDTFEALAERFAAPGEAPGLYPRQANYQGGLHRAGMFLARLAKSLGVPVRTASPYDEFMHRFHNFLKQNAEFQKTCSKSRWEFPSNSSWIVFTDMVSHAVLSGQFALEQTYIVSRNVLTLPAKAPVSILERLCGRPLTN